MNPYSQLHMMQQAGMGQFVPGMGMMSPQAGGAASLQAMASAYGSPISGERMVDTSPMAGVGYSGPAAGLVNFAGNMLLTPMMQSTGLMPMGNAGSYEQARRAQQFQNMQQEVIQGVAQQDANSLFRNMRGAAALAGMPMNADQTAAARSLASTLASAGPSLEMFAPGLLDAVSGETGSVQSLASQVMAANRYRVDPTTGQMGFSAESNQQLVEGLFEDMFNTDNLTSMRGMRAGDMGQLYNRLSAEGLAGPQGNLRERTIRAIQGIQGGGGNASLTAQAQEMGIDLNNLAGVDNAQLATLRETSTEVSSRITESDTDRISGQLQDYVSSLSAIREVFGENGNPNAPIPELIGALEALTNNKMQQFDASRLNTMVRDMQSLSQASGKSIDQLTAMQRNNIAGINAMTGFGGEHFAAASTGYGVTTGQAFQQVGGARGFGALSRTEAESAAQGLFNRSMDSVMANSMGVIARIEDSGGINDSAAGKDLRAAMSAVRNGDEFYRDSNGVSRRTPTREEDFRSFMQRGAVDGMGVSDFNMMLSQDFANKEALAGDIDLQRGAVRQQFFEFEDKVDREATATVLGTAPLRRLESGRVRSGAASGLTAAATDAMFALSPEEFADESIRRQAMIDAMQAEAAGIDGLTLSDTEARQLADQIYGRSNEVARERTGLSTLGLMQTQGRTVSNAQRSAESQASALAGRNEAMSALGPKGSAMQRMFGAIQKAGDRGEEADLTTLMGDMFGAVDLDASDLSEGMQKVRDLRQQSIELSSQLEGASPERRRELDEQIRGINSELAEATANVQDEGRRIGVVNVEGEFNYTDINRSREALREISSRSDRTALRDFLSTNATVSKKELQDAAGSKISADDLAVMVENTREQGQALLGTITDDMILGSDAAAFAEGPLGDAQREVAESMREQVTSSMEGGNLTEAAALRNARETIANNIRTADYAKDFEGVKNLGDLPDEELQKTVMRARKARESDELLSVSQEDVEQRMEELRGDLAPLGDDATPMDVLNRQSVLDARMSDEDFDAEISTMQQNNAPENVIAERKRLRRRQQSQEFKAAQDQLIAERGLKAVGLLDEDASLVDQLPGLDGADISDEVKELILSGDPTKQREALTRLAQEKRRAGLFSGGTDRGDISKMDVRGTADSLAMLDASADEYLRDADAIMRGGEAGLSAANDYQEARKDLQAMANKFSVEKGELGAGELLARGVDPTAVTEAANEEFDSMGAEEKDAAFKKVNEAIANNEALKERFGGIDLAADPTAFKEAYAAVRMGEEQQKLDNIRGRLESAAEGMESGAATDYRNILDVSDEQVAAAKELFGEDADVSAAQAKAYDLLQSAGELGDDPAKNKERVNQVASDLEQLQMMDADANKGLDAKARTEEAAKREYERSDLKETMTEEEYLKAVRGDGDLNELKMFGGDAAKLSEAEADIQAKDRLSRKIADEKESLRRAGGKDVGRQKTIEQLEGQLGQVQGRIDKSRGDLSEEDFRIKLSQQDDVLKLEERRKQYAKQGGDSSLLGTRDLLIQDARDEASKLGEAGDPTDSLLKAIGFGLDDDAREIAKDKGFGSSQENMRMVADELKKLESIEVKGAETELEKLDVIANQYAGTGASSTKKDALAKELGMDREDLDRMMSRTDFMGLDKEGMQFMGSSQAEQAEELLSMFKSVEDKDLDKEVQEEEDRTMRLSGVLEVVGDIAGQATLSDVTGKSNAAGAL